MARQTGRRSRNKISRRYLCWTGETNEQDSFVTAPYFCWGVQVVGTWPPLHLAYLAGAALEAGDEAKIYDAMNKKHSFEKIREEIQRYQPDYVMTLDYLPVTGAISTATVPAALRILIIAKEVNPNIVTLLGGPHPSFMYEEIYEDRKNRVDYILCGEPEQTLKDLIPRFQGRGQECRRYCVPRRRQDCGQQDGTTTSSSSTTSNPLGTSSTGTTTSTRSHPAAGWPPS